MRKHSEVIQKVETLLNVDAGSLATNPHGALQQATKISAKTFYLQTPEKRRDEHSQRVCFRRGAFMIHLGVREKFQTL